MSRPIIGKVAVFCDHANEVPSRCPCPPECYCREKGNTCSRRPRAGMVVPKGDECDLLTKPQQDELARLAREPQPTYGSARTRVQNTLVRMGLARYAADGDRCVITPEGTAAAASSGRRQDVAIGDGEPDPLGQGPAVPAVRHYYIQDSRSYWGDALVWWRPEGKGYTVDFDQAGLFDEGFLKGLRKTDVPWPEEAVVAARKTRVVVAGSLRIAASRQGDGE